MNVMNGSGNKIKTNYLLCKKNFFKRKHFITSMYLSLFNVYKSKHSTHSWSKQSFSIFNFFDKFLNTSVGDPLKICRIKCFEEKKNQKHSSVPITSLPSTYLDREIFNNMFIAKKFVRE